VVLLHSTTPKTDPLSLHDALPISPRTTPERGFDPSTMIDPVAIANGSRSSASGSGSRNIDGTSRPPARLFALNSVSTCTSIRSRSEEHTSELQSRENLVCRLLLEK